MFNARLKPGAGGEGIVDGHIDAFQHRGQHLARMQVVLVAIDANRQDVLIRCGLQHADPGATSRRKDDIRPLRDLRTGQLGALDRIVPRSRGAARHVLHDFNIRVGRFRALRIATGEPTDQRNVHPADEAYGAGFRGGSRQNADEIRALFLGEFDRQHVGLIDFLVNDDELGIRIIGGHHVERVRDRKARHHNRVGALLCKAAQGLLTLGFGLQFQLFIAAAGFFLPALRTVIGRLIEALIELAAEIEDQRRLREARTCGERERRRRAEDGGLAPRYP